MKISLVALLFLTLTSAQTIQLGAIKFDLDGCVDSSGVNACYNQAQVAEAQGYKVCNSTSNDASCGVGVTANYYQDVIMCMAGGCWNRVSATL